MHERHVYDDPSFPVFLHLDRVGGKKRVLEHWHENAELLYVIKGRLCVRAGDGEYVVGAGCIAPINSGAIHSLWADGGSECDYYCLIVDLALISAFGIDMAKVSLKRKVEDSEAAEVFERILELWRRQGSGWRPAVAALSCYLYILLYNRFADLNLQQQADTAPIKEAISFMRDNLGEPITTALLAKRAGFDKSYFCRLFKKSTGQTAIQYLHAIRLENARRLLLGGQCSIAQAAQLSGFGSRSYFTRLYLKTYGTLPSEQKNKL